MNADSLSLDHLFGLTGRTALVTGAGRGIGAAMARGLDAAGARVVLCSRDVDQLTSVAANLHNQPIVLPADLGAADGVATVLKTLADAGTHVDILVNNAGTQTAARSTAVSDEMWEVVTGLNLRAGFQLARGLIPAMADAGWGRVVNVASILGLVGEAHAAPYVASKAGLIGLTRALAAEWAARGVIINALCPGWIDTALVAALHANVDFDARVVRRTPARRWGRPDDLIGPLLLLAGPASEFLIGQTLVVDGGLTSWW